MSKLIAGDVLKNVGELAEERLLRLPPAKMEALLARLAKEDAKSASGADAATARPEHGQAASLLQTAAPNDELDPARRHFLPFVHHLWPNFIQGQHHKAIANAFERIVNGS